jgi:hypothetical protein
MPPTTVLAKVGRQVLPAKAPCQILAALLGFGAGRVFDLAKTAFRAVPGCVVDGHVSQIHHFLLNLFIQRRDPASAQEPVMQFLAAVKPRTQLHRPSVVRW